MAFSGHKEVGEIVDEISLKVPFPRRRKEEGISMRRGIISLPAFVFMLSS